MNKVISKKLNHAILNMDLGDIINYMFFVGILLGLYGIWSIYNTKQQAVSLMAQYTELHAKPYVTLQENKKIFNQANRAYNDTDNIIKKMDDTTVVDNKNGHEYLVNTTLSKDGNSQYQLVAKINDKNAVINKAWLKEHSKE